MKFICTSIDSLPASLAPDERAFTFFKASGRPGVGIVASALKGSLKRQGYRPTRTQWDFLQLCLAVCATDFAAPRRTSADGWTRVLDLTVGLLEPLRWAPHVPKLESMLRLLTGDFWTLRFTAGGVAPPEGKDKPIDSDCVSLLSGGLDSLIGGIDLVKLGRKPLLVSQKAFEDTDRQRRIAAALGRKAAHLQLSHGIYIIGDRESSTRARSLAFYAFAVVAASRIKADAVDIFVPENGFISINPPLVPGRVSSLSTRTTHPRFIRELQEVLDAVGINVRLHLPYGLLTKGQMMNQCRDQGLLTSLAGDTTSCGRYRTYNRRHCGRCVPCMIRRAAFLAWGPDTTKEYAHPSLKGSDKSSGPDDPMAAALAVLEAKNRGLDRFLGATLAFAQPGERAGFRAMLQSGLDELEALLRHDGIL
jgi:7-cyano-7-deazaguanine synthase in queuosine biosynthesis